MLERLRGRPTSKTPTVKSDKVRPSWRCPSLNCIKNHLFICLFFSVIVVILNLVVVLADKKNTAAYIPHKYWNVQGKTK